MKLFEKSLEIYLETMKRLTSANFSRSVPAAGGPATRMMCRGAMLGTIFRRQPMCWPISRS